MEHILLFTASGDSEVKAFQPIGTRLVTTLLDDYLLSVNYSLSSNKPDVLTAAGLRLLTVGVVQGKMSALEILDKFDFGSNRMNSLPQRNKVFQEGVDNVRTCFIKLAVSFLVSGNIKVIVKVMSLKSKSLFY